MSSDYIAPPGSKAATRRQMWILWYRLLGAYVEYLEKTPRSKMSAVWLDQIRQFLRENNIGVDGMAIQDLKKGLRELHGFAVPFNKKGIK